MAKMSDLPAEELREKMQVFYEATASYQSRMLAASSSYNQVVVLAAYVGFFTIWSATRDDVPHWLLLISGALMALSLIVYVTWTVYGMTVQTKCMRALMNEIEKGPNDYLQRIQAQEAKNVGDVAKYTSFWKLALWGAGLPGLIAGVLLTGGAFAAVVTSEHSTQQKRDAPAPCASASAAKRLRR